MEKLSTEHTSKESAPSADFVDIERLFKEKNPRMYRLIPGFIFAYLKKVTHQDKVNWALREFKDLEGIDFIDAILNYFGVIVQTVGFERLPAKGRQIIASNHPLGGLDGMALMREVAKVRRDFLFPVNDLLLNIPNLRNYFIPINKHGSNAENIQIINDAFASEKLLLYFPAGLVSRKEKGIIKDIPWKKTFLSKAIQYRRDVIPVHITGRNTNFFYNLARWRKKLGIKANIEMLYLVDEMFKQKDKIIRITFGKPISFTTFDKRKSPAEWAALLREFVYLLGNDPNISFEEQVSSFQVTKQH